MFKGRVEAAATVGEQAGHHPLDRADGRGMTGINTIFIDDRDPFAHGFVVK